MKFAIELDVRGVVQIIIDEGFQFSFTRYITINLWTKTKFRPIYLPRDPRGFKFQ